MSIEMHLCCMEHETLQKYQKFCNNLGKYLDKVERRLKSTNQAYKICASTTVKLFIDDINELFETTVNAPRAPVKPKKECKPCRQQN